MSITLSQEQHQSSGPQSLVCIRLPRRVWQNTDSRPTLSFRFCRSGLGSNHFLFLMSFQAVLTLSVQKLYLVSFCFCFCLFVFYLARSQFIYQVLVVAHVIYLCCGMWDILLQHVESSSLTRGQPRAPCIGSVESQPLDHKGSPQKLHLESHQYIMTKCDTFSGGEILGVLGESSTGSSLRLEESQKSPLRKGHLN